MSGRALKKTILGLLQEDADRWQTEILRFPARKAVNPLFSFFHHADEAVRWRAVAAMGIITADLANQDMESARVIMRRLMWTLNDESGGIGWGSPEAMGEIAARHRGLAEEFGKILISYIREDGNYLEHEMLQRGALWGLGRLAHAHPDLAGDAAPFLAPFLKSDDPHLRGLAAWIAGPVKARETKPLLNALSNDNAVIRMFTADGFVEQSVGKLAKDALSSF